MINYHKVFCITVIVQLLLYCQFSFSQVEHSVIKTDSSVIQEQYSPNGTKRMEYIFNKAVIKYEWRNKKGVVLTNGTHDTIGNLICTWYEYDSTGKLIKTEDFNKRTWQAVDKKVYPFKKYLDKVKGNADRIIIREYGLDFFRNHVKWNIMTSTAYFPDGAGANWTDAFKRKPTSFLIRYDVLLDSTLYDDMIEVEMDANGKLISNTACVSEKGFEKVKFKHPFILDKASVFNVAKQKGLKSHVSETDFRLVWECKDKEDSTKYNGRYLFYVYAKKGIKETNLPEDKKHRFVVFVFNPWDGSFVEKKEVVFSNEFLFPTKESLVNHFRKLIK